MRHADIEVTVSVFSDELFNEVEVLDRVTARWPGGADRAYVAGLLLGDSLLHVRPFEPGELDTYLERLLARRSTFFSARRALIARGAELAS